MADAESGEPAAQTAPLVVILADDLIWSTRLADAVGAAGGRPTPVRRLADLEGRLSDGAASDRRVIIDLTARAYDGVEAVRVARSLGARVIAVGQHDDVPLRKSAIAAGAERVHTYRALFEGGPRTLGAWLAR